MESKDQEPKQLDKAKVSEIIRNVKTGLRAKRELKLCGCPECKEALRILNGGM